MQRVHQVHAVLQDTDQEARDDVDAGDENARHRVALSEARGTVHGAVEFGFRGECFAAFARSFFIDETGVEVGVDGHLFTG